MVFVKREGTTGPKTLDFRSVGIAVAFLIFLLLATFYSHNISWDSGADSLMTAFTSGVGVFIGALFGESVAT